LAVKRALFQIFEPFPGMGRVGEYSFSYLRQYLSTNLWRKRALRAKRASFLIFEPSSGLGKVGDRGFNSETY